MKTEDITIPWRCSIDVIYMYNSLGIWMKAELGETFRNFMSGWSTMKQGSESTART